MKKTRQFMMLIAMMAISTTLFAQLPNGSYAKDFSMKKLKSDGTAISDTVCTLYEHTNAGRPVIMDVSAVWCSPCWSYHSSGALESLYASYGPSGDNSLMVYFVEGDEGSIAQLNGGAGSQGNWVTGTYYPILPTISPNTTQVCTDYSIGYFPTVYLICPDRTVTEVGSKTAAIIHTAAVACPVLTTNVLDAKIFKINQPGNLVYCGEINPKVFMQNYGTTAISSATIKMQLDGVDVITYNWTGNIERLDAVEVSLPTYSNPTLSQGNHTLTFVIENPNGGTDLNLADNSKTITVFNMLNVSSLPIVESFVNSTFPSPDWGVDPGSDGMGWARSTAHSGCAKIAFYEISSKQIDYLVLPPVNLSSVTSMNLTFKVAYAQYSSSFADKLEVQTSTNCGATWVSRYTKSGSTLSTSTATTSAFTPTAETQWRQETVDLTSLAGQAKVMVRFKATSAYGNNAYVDDINLDIAGGVNSNEMVSGMLLSPNPSNSNTNLDFYAHQANDVSIVVVNAIGAVVYSSKVNASQGFNTLVIPSEDFNSGIYFVSIKGKNSNSTQKLIIQK